MGELLCLVIPLIFIIAALISSALSDDTDNNPRSLLNEIENHVKDEWEKQNYFITINNIIPVIDYGFRNYSENIRTRYVVDGRNQMIYIAYNNENFIRIPFSDIVGFEILSDIRNESQTHSSTNGGVGRAFAGYLLAGGVGAIVGAATAKKTETTTNIQKIGNYRIVFYLTYINKPSLVLPLVNNYVLETSYDYSSAVNFANKVNASIRSIIEMSNRLRQMSYVNAQNSQMYSENAGQLPPGISTPYNQQYSNQNMYPQSYPNIRR